MEATQAFLETPGSQAHMVQVLTGWWSSVPDEWPVLVLFGALLWLMLFVQVRHARALLTRTMTAVLQVDARLQQLEAEVLGWRTSAMAAQSVPPQTPDASGGDGAMHAEFDLHAQFVLACQDVRGMTMTTQHACDWMGSATKLISAQHDEMGDLTRAHIELSKAVNKMLDDLSNRTAGSAAADSIPTSWVQELKDALAPSVKAMKDLKSLVESGLNGVNHQLADQDLTPFKDTLKDFFIRFEDGCEKLTKGLDLLKQGGTQGSNGGNNQQVLDALGAMKTVVQNLGTPSKEVLDAVATVKVAAGSKARRWSRSRELRQQAYTKKLACSRGKTTNFTRMGSP